MGQGPSSTSGSCSDLRADCSAGRRKSSLMTEFTEDEKSSLTHSFQVLFPSVGGKNSGVPSPTTNAKVYNVLTAYIPSDVVIPHSSPHPTSFQNVISRIFPDPSFSHMLLNYLLASSGGKGATLVNFAKAAVSLVKSSSSSSSPQDKAQLLEFQETGTSPPRLDGFQILKSLVSPASSSGVNDRFINYILDTCLPTASTNEDLDFLNPSKTPTNYAEERANMIALAGKATITSATLASWIQQSVLLQRLWNLIFMAFFFNIDQLLNMSSGSSNNNNNNLSLLSVESGLPSLTNDHFKGSKLLSTEDIYVLHHSIPVKQQSKLGTWKLLFSTSVHGSSWTNFVTACEDAGSTLLIIKDKGGDVFGGFASKPLFPSSKFFGNGDSFVFSLAPTLRVFHSTGINENFIYFNYDTRTLPNGLAFGGQMDYFGLWISADFENGYCRASPTSTTFGNPTLSSSSSSDFKIDYIEAWLVQPHEKRDYHLPSKKSAMANNPELQEFLEMGGVKMWSKDVQDRRDVVDEVNEDA